MLESIPLGPRVTENTHEKKNKLKGKSVEEILEMYFL